MKDILKNRLYDNYVQKFINECNSYIEKENIGFISNDDCNIQILFIICNITENIDMFNDEQFNNIMYLLNEFDYGQFN